jgi:hypothetical protein
MPQKWILLLFPVLTVGWFGTRTAMHIRQSKGKPQDLLFMLAVCWVPFMVWCIALLLSLCGSPS